MPLPSAYSKEAIEAQLNEAFCVENTIGIMTHGR